MKLFLDDIRAPFECAQYMHKRIGKLNPIYLEGEWYIVKNYDQFVKAISLYHKTITHISFDHDLADMHYHESMDQGKEAYEDHLKTVTEKTGYNCAKFMKDFYDRFAIDYPVLFVHSMNPVGTENIINLFKRK